MTTPSKIDWAGDVINGYEIHEAVYMELGGGARKAPSGGLGSRERRCGRNAGLFERGRFERDCAWLGFLPLKSIWIPVGLHHGAL